MKPLVLYVASIVAANWLTNTFGLLHAVGLAVTYGTFAAGLALVLRDGVQVQLGKAWVLVAIAIGVALSYATSTPALAIASAIAFLVSELVDLSVFTPLKRNLPIAVLASSIVSAPVDTVLFLSIAGFPLTVNTVVGQFIVKTALAAIVAWRLSCSISQEA